MVKAYVPFRFRYTPVVRTVLIKFTKDPDEFYHAFELQVIEQNNELFYQVLATRRDDDYRDIYQDPRIKIDNEELELIVGGAGLGDVFQTEFTKGYFAEADGHVQIGFTFEDKEGRRVDFSVDEDLEKDSKHLSWLPSIGSRTEEPKSVPLFFAYNFDFIRKAETDVKLTIGDVEHEIDPYAFPKDFQARINIQYALNTDLVSFNEARNTTMPAIELNELGESEFNGKKYTYQIDGEKIHLERISLDKGYRPVDVLFDPPFPDYTTIEENIPQFGEFVIQPSEELGNLTGRYNVTKQANKVIINLSFTEGWNPNEKEMYVKILKERSSNRIRDWYREYQCTEIIDLETFETEVTWKKVDPERNKQA